jgi:3-phosphoshikimate 1-carboxyvinyltransferase
MVRARPEDAVTAELPERLEIPTRGAISAVVRPPGSKSITNRVLPVAALARGESLLLGALHSDDTRVMLECLAALGCEVTPDDWLWKVRGSDGRLRGSPEAPERGGAGVAGPPVTLHTGNSGTTARFLTAVATLADGPVVVDGGPRMRERPIDDLVSALRQLGAGLEVLGERGCPPVRVAGGGLPGGKAVIDASRSSQYVSAVLLAAPYARADVEVSFQRGVLVSRPYVDLTVQVMRAFGARVDWTDAGSLRVAAGPTYRGGRYQVEPDASAAAYPFCAAAITGGRVRVEGIPADSIQADLALLPILERMGCTVRRGADHAEVIGPPGRLQGVDVDMNALPDATLALAVTALFAEGPTRIRNVANLRIKETDRLSALETELRKLGASARSTEDSLTIEPGPQRGAEIDTYDDHRIAMAFALAGLRIPGVVIRNPACVSKTWPDYFSVLEHL